MYITSITLCSIRFPKYLTLTLSDMQQVFRLCITLFTMLLFTKSRTFPFDGKSVFFEVVYKSILIPNLLSRILSFCYVLCLFVIALKCSCDRFNIKHIFSFRAYNQVDLNSKRMCYIQMKHQATISHRLK
jgi:hypothetical protein